MASGKSGDGLVPTSYIKILDKKLYTATALFSFDGDEANDLSFSASDLIQIWYVKHEWGIGFCNEKIGYVPLNYV